LCQLRRETIRTRFVKVSAIGNAADERETPALRLDGEFLRGHDVPDDVRTIERDVGRIAVVARQIELVDGEAAHRLDARQRALQRRIGGWVRDDLVDRLALA